MSTQSFNQKMRPSMPEGEPMEQEVEDQGLTAGNADQPSNAVNMPTLDMNDLKFSIKSTDMSENMILYVVEKTILAYESTRQMIFTKKESKKSDQDTNMCRQLQYYLDSLYGHSWHVICGGNYGAFFTHVKGSFIVYTFEDNWITAFQTA